ncbi:tetratricopeptide repeat protein 19 homolog, mitochondrial isoform X2 [Musca domestica]|uniref:Tetratricopeptide repeat protein 19 homolog, mitochondrial isoform X2 n=1 Tax=Musca domestica TaxID=7370 RepID=A0ABM3VE38_MUSDO|nr:tetratricopeptide repeat protein 19 homolog, mitochondrial isoform X2 [Musca domestica]
MSYRILRCSCYVKRALCIRLNTPKSKRNMFVHKKNNSNYKIASFFSLSISLFGFGLKDDETPEDKLTNTIKRAIMSINNQQYEKAEQILHLALRMAQDLQSRDGITYVYDVMANLALEREQYEKAEKLFSEVMKRLLEEGYQEDNLKVIHISLKLANIAHHLGKVEKSMLGFNWTLPKIEKRAESNPDDVEIKEIFGLAKYCAISAH